ncbi:MAG TPA: carboxypeptidase-like regulatory domain-containing protein [Gemmatimonadaceae bacterium]|nr:carboxypeptidase-like regulatory domain-containing protein [Gemmatimonadaceae bacterium]
MPRAPSALEIAAALTLLAVPRARATPASARSVAAADTGRGDTATTEPVIVELRVGRLAASTVSALRRGDDALVPAGALLDLVEMRHRVARPGRMEVERSPSEPPLVFDTALAVQGGGAHVVRARVLWRDGEIYVPARTMGTLLDARIVVDWGELVITIADPASLPIAKRLAREAARERFLARRRGALAPDLRLGLSRPAWAGMVLDYAISAPGDRPVAGSDYSLALGADVFGGSLTGTMASVGGASAGRVRGEGSWNGVWPDSRTVQQLRVGDAVASGPTPRTLRGAYVTNSPYLRSSEFGVLDYAGRVLPGWSVEAYRAGSLVAIDSADAAGRFDVPLPVEYGENPIDFIAYGPYGETRTLSRTYRIGADLLPARRFEYGASVGACTRLSCTETANLDLRYGLSSRWTLRAGADQIARDSLGGLFQPYAGVTGTIASAWTVRLQAQRQGAVQTTVRFEPSLDLRFDASWSRYDDRVTAPLLTPAGRRAEWAASAFVRPLGYRTPLYAELTYDRVETALGAITRARVATSYQRGELRVLPYARIERETGAGVPPSTETFTGLDAFFLPHPSWGPVLGPLWWRAGAELSDAGTVTASEVTVARPIGGALRFELGATHVPGPHGTTFSLTLSADRSLLRSYSTMVAQSGGTPRVTQTVQGSVLADRATHAVRFVPGPSLERAGVVGRVFLDANGNGRFDPGEPPLANVYVRVGTGAAATDSAGLFRVWDVVPFEPVRVAVDSSSLASPLWVPTYGTLEVVPGPNRFQPVDVPIAPGGIVEGEVRLAGDGRGVPGARLILTNRRTHAARAVTTFTDGAFSLLGVAPGSYELGVDPADLAVLHATAEPVRVEVPADVDGARVEGVRLIVRR